mmetsp:Transcript_21424/g.47775  ORF Transcript_21424/g.47775 Transcript_21424/m.47775 type:complete len:268 (-) Transcript_21424:1100-1903(-)
MKPAAPKRLLRIIAPSLSPAPTGAMKATLQRIPNLTSSSAFPSAAAARAPAALRTSWSASAATSSSTSMLAQMLARLPFGALLICAPPSSAICAASSSSSCACFSSQRACARRKRPPARSIAAPLEGSEAGCIQSVVGTKAMTMQSRADQLKETEMTSRPRATSKVGERSLSRASLALWRTSLEDEGACARRSRASSTRDSKTGSPPSSLATSCSSAAMHCTNCSLLVVCFSVSETSLMAPIASETAEDSMGTRVLHSRLEKWTMCV